MQRGYRKSNTGSKPPVCYRRIIFWHDEDREFEDKLDEIQLDNAKLVALNGNNTFLVKKLLSNDDLTSNYLVYNPLSFDKPDDDWLIDVKLYSEEFRADLISMWMDEMGLVSNFAIRKEVKHYRKFFNAKDRRAKVAAQSKTPEKPGETGTAAHGCHGGNLRYQRPPAESDHAVCVSCWFG